MISLIVAASTNNAIGKNNKMLWHLPEDFKYFKNVTWGMPVIMGRKTFESIGKALPGRTNIIITRDTTWTAEGVQVANTIEQALVFAKQTNTKEIFIAGGAEIYNQTIGIADKIYLTKVDKYIDDADAYFPELAEKDWKLIFEKNIKADKKNIFDMSFKQLERI